MMTATFAVNGFMSSMMAQAIMLGANVGTSIVTRLLALDLHFLAPILIVAGVAAFGFSRSKPAKGASRALLGLGIMLLPLHLLGQPPLVLSKGEALVALGGVLVGRLAAHGVEMREELGIEPVVVDGSPRMRERPVEEGIALLRRLGARIEATRAGQPAPPRRCSSPTTGAIPRGATR